MSDKPAQAHLVIGDDEYLVSRKARQLIDAHLAGASADLTLERIDGQADTGDRAVAAVRACRAALRSADMFAPRRAVWFENVTFLSDTRAGQAAATREALNEFAAQVKAGWQDETLLVITAEKADKRYALYKAFVAAGNVHDLGTAERPRERERRAEGTLAELLKERGLQMNAAARDVFLQKVGTDTRHLVSELDKLAVYLGDARVATEADISAIVSASRESEAWDLADAVAQRRLKDALDIHAQLAFQNVSPILMLIAIGGKLRDMLILREALDRGWVRIESGGRESLQWAALSAEAEECLGRLQRDPRKGNPYPTLLAAKAAQRFTVESLTQCLLDVTQTHVALVSTSADAHELVKLLIAKLLTRA